MSWARIFAIPGGNRLYKINDDEKPQVIADPRLVANLYYLAAEDLQLWLA
jgi:hypothetical protein